MCFDVLRLCARLTDGFFVWVVYVFRKRRCRFDGCCCVFMGFMYVFVYEFWGISRFVGLKVYVNQRRRHVAVKGVIVLQFTIFFFVTCDNLVFAIRFVFSLFKTLPGIA